MRQRSCFPSLSHSEAERCGTLLWHEVVLAAPRPTDLAELLILGMIYVCEHRSMSEIYPHFHLAKDPSLNAPQIVSRDVCSISFTDSLARSFVKSPSCHLPGIYMADLFYLHFFQQTYQEFNNPNPALRILIGR
jgi:hypothetical protein